jgi:hypothetical protein
MIRPMRWKCKPREAISLALLVRVPIVLLVAKLCLGTPGCEALLRSRMRRRRKAELPNLRPQTESLATSQNEGKKKGKIFHFFLDKRPAPHEDERVK